MKISAQDEYGLRILLRIAKAHPEEGLSLAQISELENISQAYVAKITRSLRLGGFIQSIRGHKGGKLSLCTNSIDCSVRSLWTIVQHNMDKLLDSITIHDLMKPESETRQILEVKSTGLEIA
jgi:Rrf2 family iron-sulfur cluster assembly transcriptional regulator